MPPHLCCSCGRPLKIQVRRGGVVFRCEEHGIVWRFVADIYEEKKLSDDEREGKAKRGEKRDR